NDESTGYVLPNKTLIEIVKTMPSTIGELFCIKSAKNGAKFFRTSVAVLLWGYCKQRI
nr:protein RRP6-like 2 [Tanacetum cinerariifolium]